ncbi:hypothetical protein [Hymenobacter saemangeumensis]
MSVLTETPNSVASSDLDFAAEGGSADIASWLTEEKSNETVSKNTTP